MLSLRLAVGVCSRSFRLTLILRWGRWTRWFWRMTSTAITLSDRLKLATEIVTRTEFGRCRLWRGYRRILVRLKFILRLRGRIFHRCLFRHRWFFRQRRWSRSQHRLSSGCPFLREFPLHLFSYIHRLLQRRTLQFLFQFVIVLFVAIYIGLHFLAFLRYVLPFLW